MGRKIACSFASRGKLMAYKDAGDASCIEGFKILRLPDFQLFDLSRPIASVSRIVR